MVTPDLQSLAAALGGEVAGGQVLCPGPGHARKDRSLSVKPDPSAPDGFVVFSHSEDDPLVCRDFVRERMGMPKWQPRQKRTANIDYIYKDAEGRPYLRVTRTPEKKFWQHKWDGKAWVKGAPRPKIPYRLPELLTAPADAPVYVCEGEKNTDAVRALGLVATTNSEGAGKWTADLSPYLAGRTCYVLEDNDEKGAIQVRTVSEMLGGVAAEIRIVALPGLGPKHDVEDWIKAGGTAAALEAICRSAPLYGAQVKGERCADQADGPATASNVVALKPKAGAAQRGVRGSAEPPMGDLDRLNAEFCVVLDTGKARVLSFETVRQEKHSREVACFLSFEDFRNFHLNRFVEVGDKKVPLGHWWLRHPDRRQYRGLTFEPAAEREINGRLNLWRGWGVEPTAGDWSLMRRHVVEVLASGNAAHADYIVRWIAWTVQHPARRAEAAIVFKGKRGTGKGTLGNALCRIFGQHGTHISSADHLAGRFNGHLRDACFLFADEAYWPGDKGAEGSLKRLVTEPDLFIEAKGKDGVTVPNMLHVMMASNEDWIVPAGEDERRYAVFNVSDCHKQDEAWFGPLNAQLDAGGYAAMLHDLLRMDLGDFHPRKVPRTEALVEQQSRGLGPEDAWWCELLETGVLVGCEPQRPERAVSNGWEEDDATGRKVRRKGLYDQARETSPRLRGLTDHALGNVLTTHGCTNDKKVMRRRGWHFPPLADARRAWEIRFPGWKWRTPDLIEWHREAEDCSAFRSGT